MLYIVDSIIELSIKQTGAVWQMFFWKAYTRSLSIARAPYMIFDDAGCLVVFYLSRYYKFRVVPCFSHCCTVSFLLTDSTIFMRQLSLHAQIGRAAFVMSCTYTLTTSNTAFWTTGCTVAAKYRDTSNSFFQSNKDLKWIFDGFLRYMFQVMGLGIPVMVAIDKTHKVDLSPPGIDFPVKFSVIFLCSTWANVSLRDKRFSRWLHNANIKHKKQQKTNYSLQEVQGRIINHSVKLDEKFVIFSTTFALIPASLHFNAVDGPKRLQETLAPYYRTGNINFQDILDKYEDMSKNSHYNQISHVLSFA